MAWLSGEATGIGLVRSERPAVAEFACVYFTVKGVGALLRHCQGAGATVAVPLTRHPSGHRDFVVKAPDGHSIAIGETDDRRSAIVSEPAR